jgi:hypothetical protein
MLLIMVRDNNLLDLQAHSTYIVSSVLPTQVEPWLN